MRPAGPAGGFRSWIVAAVVFGLVVAAVPPVVWAGLPPGGTFTDDNGHVAEGAIEAIAAEGITKGCNPPANDRFCPDGTVTRGQMAAFLVRALHLPPTSVDYFTDDSTSVFEDAINALAEAGITKGCNPPANTKFCPDGFVSREQMAGFLVRAFDYTEGAGADLFVDDDTSIFESAIDRIGTAGVTKGCNPPVNDKFCPKELVKRSQMASFLTRALGLTPIFPPPPEAGDLTVVFVAVRQGDAAVYQGACGEIGVIDTNRFRSAEVLAVLDELGSRKLEWMAVSHYDADHLGGVLDVVDAPGVSVGVFYDRGGVAGEKATQTYANYYAHVTNTGTRHPLDIGDGFSLCSGTEKVTFSVVSAGTDGTAAGGVSVSEENDKGLCIHVEYGDFDLATCGDINGTNEGSRTNIESAVAATIGDVEVAKVNHHGSSFSSNLNYVAALSAEAAVISVGKNSFGHPNTTVISRWDTYGTVFQTQSAADNTLIDGDITVTTDGATSFTVIGEQSGTTVTSLLDET